MPDRFTEGLAELLKTAKQEMPDQVKLTKDISIAEVFVKDEYFEEDVVVFRKGETYEVLHKFPTRKTDSGIAYVLFDGLDSVTVDARFVEETKGDD